MRMVLRRVDTAPAGNVGANRAGIQVGNSSGVKDQSARLGSNPPDGFEDLVVRRHDNYFQVVNSKCQASADEWERLNRWTRAVTPTPDTPA
jgi:hypothetical protein